MQRPMSNNMHTLNFHATSNIQHTTFHTSTAEQVHMPMSNCQGQTNVVSSANLYDAPYANNSSTIQQGVSYINSSAANSQYLTSSRSMPMNAKFGHTDFSYPANYSQTSYTAQHVTTAEIASTISAPHANLHSYDSAPSVISDPSRISENLATSHAPLNASAANMFSKFYRLFEQLFRAWNQEYKFEKAKESGETHQSKTHIDCESNTSDDEIKGKIRIWIIIWLC